MCILVASVFLFVLEPPWTILCGYLTGLKGVSCLCAKSLCSRFVKISHFLCCSSFFLGGEERTGPQCFPLPSPSPQFGLFLQVPNKYLFRNLCFQLSYFGTGSLNLWFWDSCPEEQFLILQPFFVRPFRKLEEMCCCSVSWVSSWIIPILFCS